MSRPRRPRSSAEPDAPELDLEPPEGLRSSRMSLGNQEYVVLSYPAPRRALPSTLTPAEREVALLVRRGLSNAEIARARGVALRTVANQIACLFRKLGVSSRVELARRVAG
ncbi:MAG: helix-turn-helix transcriptional regulator [Myxococcales bacterium]|nr:helix-turn-helix transcriptional regulator [Myxococcales bacterium]